MTPDAATLAGSPPRLRGGVPLAGSPRSPLRGVPLARAMTRPTTVAGFTLSSLFWAVGLPMFGVTSSGSLWPLVAIPPLLAIAWAICLYDIFFFDVLAARSRLKASRNQRLWGCRTYAPR